jgi:signal transduction histidine kinase
MPFTHPSNRGVVISHHRSRRATPGVTDPGDVSARAEALLRATNEFLRADDLPALGQAVTDAAVAMFGESKAAVSLARADGSIALMSTAGLSAAEIDKLGTLVAQDGRLLQSVVAGEELWSDDGAVENLRARVAAWGGGSGLSIPIHSSTGVAGILSLLFDEERVFDPGFRDSVRSLAAQAGLAHELIAAREELRQQRELLASSVAERTVQLRGAIEELRSASQAKTDFLANVSHELRTPLTAILGFTEVLIRGDDGPLNPRQHEDVTTVLSSGRQLLALIDDLIDISRIEGNRLELEMRPLDLGPLLSGVVEELRALAGAKGIGLTLIPAVDQLTVVGDRVRLHEVFLNLVSNAVKFTQPGGTVRVVAGIEASVAGDGQQVRVDVIDTGIGVAEDEQEKIFEKFHRIAGQEYPGTGLGLSIARELVVRHGGKLSVDSTVGLGSRFSVLLPLAASAAS